MPIRKSSSAKTYAIKLCPTCICQKVRIKNAAMLCGFYSAFQVIDLAAPTRRVGRPATTANQAWTNAYLRLSEDHPK